VRKIHGRCCAQNKLNKAVQPTIYAGFVFMNKYTLAAILVIAVIGSFVAGARYGVEAFLHKDARNQAALTAANLDRLKRGEVEFTEELMTIDLAMYLSWHVQNGNSILGRLYPDISDDHRPSLCLVDRYLLRYPKQTDELLALSEEWQEDIGGLLTRMREDCVNY